MIDTCQGLDVPTPPRLRREVTTEDEAGGRSLAVAAE